MPNVFLLEDISVDTDGAAVNGDGGKMVLSIWATAWDGGTVTIQASPDNGVTWITVKTIIGVLAEFTEDSYVNLDRIGQADQVRATLTTAGVSTSGVNAKLSQ